MSRISSMSSAARWRFAVKLKSWPKLLVPALLGQALGAAAAGSLDWRAALVGLGLCLGLLIYIVLLNDWGDREVDAIKRRMFPKGCSPKTIPDGILPARALLAAGLLAGGVVLGCALVGQLWLGRPGLALGAGGALLVFVAYTFPPLKLNYRGGGELLEALGVGALLPWLQDYLQGGSHWHSNDVLLAGFTAMSLASALASGLSDERSDRSGGKRTCATWLGNGPTRRATEAALGLGAAGWLAATLGRPGAAPWWCVLPALVIVGLNSALLLAASGRATTDAFAALGVYKRYLHRAIWHGTTLLALLLLLTL
jgi:1,4-dihydroxy-2-naphthoate octaprenyltransferase/chlorophyll synthase